MDAVLISSPTLNGQEVFIRFTPSGQTEYIDLGLQLLPYTFYPDQQIPPLTNEAGTFFVYCSGLSCTYEITLADILPTPTQTPPPTPTPTPSITPTFTPTNTQTPTQTQTQTQTPTQTQTQTQTQTKTPTPTPTITPTCNQIPTLDTSLVGVIGYEISNNIYANYSSSTITISGSNVSVGQSVGNTYSWYSGATNLTPTGNTQQITFDLSGYTFPIQIDFKCINQLGCGNTLPVVITNIIDSYIDIISTTDNSVDPQCGSGNGTVTFQVVGGYPSPPYGSSETYFVFDGAFTNSGVITSNSPFTFSGYSSGTTQLDASAYNYGANPTTAFTINQAVCSPTPSIVMFNGGPYCEGQNALFFIFADADFSYSVTNPVGNVVHTGTGNSGFIIGPTTSSDSGTFTLSGCNTNGCYGELFDYLTVNSNPFIQYTFLKSAIVTPLYNDFSYSAFSATQLTIETGLTYNITQMTIDSTPFATNIQIYPPQTPASAGTECDNYGNHPICDIIFAISGQGYTFSGYSAPYVQFTPSGIDYLFDFVWVFDGIIPIEFTPNSIVVTDSSGITYNLNFNYFPPNLSCPPPTPTWYPTPSSSYPGGNYGYIEIGIGGGDGSYSVSDGLYSTFGSPAVFPSIVVDPVDYSGIFQVSDGNLCATPLLPVTLGNCLCNLPVINFSSNTPSIGGPLILSAYGGTTYRFYKIDYTGSPTYDVTVYGDPITGVTVTVTSDYQVGDAGTYAVQVTRLDTIVGSFSSPTVCTDYATIVIT